MTGGRSGRRCADVEQQTRFSIDFTARPLVSYAMAHNGVSVLNRLVIEGRGAGEGVLRLDVTDANGPLSEECTCQVGCPVPAS